MLLGVGVTRSLSGADCNQKLFVFESHYAGVYDIHDCMMRVETKFH